MNRVNTEEKTMKIQISSGQDPTECELAVAKLAHSLCKEFADTSKYCNKVVRLTNNCLPGTKRVCSSAAY
jgi:protein subunit release factor B